MSWKLDDDQQFEPIRRRVGRGASQATNKGKVKRRLKFARGEWRKSKHNRRSHKRPVPLRIEPRTGKLCNWCKKPIDLSTDNLCADCRTEHAAGAKGPE